MQLISASVEAAEEKNVSSTVENGYSAKQE